MSKDLDIIASRATAPLFYRAPFPPSKSPREFQLAGVEYSLSRDHSLIGDDPGLGKSMEGVLISNAIRAKRTLVVCPASLRLNWQREIWAWSTTPNVSTYPVLKAKDGVNLGADYLIISYALLSNPSILHAILSQHWDHVILDEAHALKDPKGNTRTKIICASDLLPSVTGRFTPMSGTILPNQPIECFNIIRLLNWDAIDRISVETFRNQYYEEGEGYIRGPYEKTLPDGGTVRMFGMHWSDHVRNVPCNLADLQYRLRKHIMVRRTKAQVLHELPPVQWHPFPLALTPAMRKVMKHPGWKKAEQLLDIDPGAFESSIPIDGAIGTARRLLGEAKAPAVADYIEDMIATGTRKIVVAAWHHSVLDILRERLGKHGLVYMDGSTSAKNKQAAVDQFQQDEKAKVILGQTMPIGEGWTLTAAQDVVNAEPDWVPGKNKQLIDRISRMGQKGSFTVGHLPIVPDSLDERVLHKAIVKEQNIYNTLDAQ